MFSPFAQWLLHTGISSGASRACSSQSDGMEVAVASSVASTCNCHKDEKKEKCVFLVLFPGSLLMVSVFVGWDMLSSYTLPLSGGAVDPRCAPWVWTKRDEHLPAPSHAMPSNIWVLPESCFCLQAHVCSMEFMESRAGLELVHLRLHSFIDTPCPCTTV